MAVKYVSEFSFPSDWGFHKPVAPKSTGVAKGMGSFHTSKAGPSVVTGHSSGKGGGKLTSGAVPKFAKGGLARVPAVGKGGSESKGIGKTDEHFAKVSDKRSPAATRSEKSSGVQKPAFKSGGHATTPQAYKKGGHATTPQAYKAGGSTLHASGCKCNYCSGGMAKKEGGSIRQPAAKVKMGEKTSWNKDDASSAGSFKRTPPGEKMTNKAAANSRFDAEGRDTAPATEQSGNVERMAGWSDFKEGGSAHPKLKNLGQYAHAKKGGSVKATRSEVSSGTAAKTGKVVNSSEMGRNEHYEAEAGTPGEATPRGDYHEIESGSAAAMGGFARGNSHKKNAAIHAKADHKAMGAMGALAGALSQPAAPGPAMGGAPPSAPPMGGAPAGMPAMRPAAPPMGRPMGPPPGMGGGMPAPGPGMPHMADGGVLHVVHHHVQH